MNSLAILSSLIFFMEGSGAGWSATCQFKLMELPSKQVKIIATLDQECPDSVRWNPQAKSAVFQSKGVPFSFQWGKHPTLKKLPQFPLPEGGWDYDYWVSRETGNLRFAYMVRPEKVESGKYIFESKAYDPPYPDWGVPWMAIVVEFDGEIWRRVGIRGTTSQAGETNGITEVDGYRDYRTSTDVLRAVRWRIWGSVEEEKGSAFAKRMKKIASQSANVQPYLYYPVNNKNAIVTGYLMVDTSVCPSLPLILCQDDCRSYRRIENPDFHHQVFFAGENDWAVVGHKYLGVKKSWVYQVSTGKLFLDLPEAQSITFFPYRELWNVLEPPVDRLEWLTGLVKRFFGVPHRD